MSRLQNRRPSYLSSDTYKLVQEMDHTSTASSPSSESPPASPPPTPRGGSGFSYRRYSQAVIAAPVPGLLAAAAAARASPEDTVERYARRSAARRESATREMMKRDLDELQAQRRMSYDLMGNIIRHKAPTSPTTNSAVSYRRPSEIRRAAGNASPGFGKADSPTSPKNVSHALSVNKLLDSPTSSKASTSPERNAKPPDSSERKSSVSSDCNPPALSESRPPTFKDSNQQPIGMVAEQNQVEGEYDPYKYLDVKTATAPPSEEIDNDDGSSEETCASSVTIELVPSKPNRVRAPVVCTLRVITGQEAEELRRAQNTKATGYTDDADELSSANSNSGTGGEASEARSDPQHVNVTSNAPEEEEEETPNDSSDNTQQEEITSDTSTDN